jgi:hypothetical protein
MGVYDLSERQLYLGSYFPQEYFSGCDVSIFFGQKEVTEITALELSVNEQVEPIFGYASYTYDTLVKGSRFVSGAFSINYISNDYLFNIVDSPKLPTPTYEIDDHIILHPGDPGYEEWQEQQKSRIWINDKRSSRKQRPYFKEPEGGITIKIKFGINHTKEPERSRHILNVQFFNPKLIISESGEPVAEQYNFIGTDYL